MNKETLPSPEVTSFFDKDSHTFSYVVKDPDSLSCAIFDPVLDFDQASGTTSTAGADQIVAHVEKLGLKLHWIIETHVHADHLSAAPYLQNRLGGKIAIGENVIAVQETFGRIFNVGDGFRRDGSQFDVLFADGDSYSIGELTGHALLTPGHTPACMTHVIGDAAFVGDTLFMPDSGSARVDFPGGDAATLYDSAQLILSLPENTRIFLCHDYGGPGREVANETTVAEQRRKNIHLNPGVSKEQYVQLREARDKTLGMPKLILPSIQINMRAGHLPGTEDNGLAYLKIPLNAFGKIERKLK